VGVVQFKKPEPAVQHGSGEAFCLACDHVWAAVAPTGTTKLECPACKRMTGHWKFEFGFDVGQLVRSCQCGNQLFYLSPDGHLCASCGIYQAY
jgi:hypothetical protein